MRRTEFEQWGAGLPHLSNLVSAAKIIEERIADLGLPYNDLDEAYEVAGFEDIFARLDTLRIQFQGGDLAALDAFLPNSPSENKLFQLASYKSRFQKYKDFMDGKPSPKTNLDSGISLPALERLKHAFLDLHSDFVTFDDCRSFAKLEGDYKRALVVEARRLVAAMAGDADEVLGAALIELLAGRAELASNLIDWRAQKVIDDAREAAPGLVEAAAGRLARADDAEAGVIAFVEAVWPLMRGDLPSNPYAESRMYPTMLRALVDPQSVLPIRSTPTDNAARMLLGQPAFANAPLSAGELAKITALAREIRRIMDEEWHWAPRDLWDVQGFIWETCQKIRGEDGLTDEELLHLFDSCDYFRTRRVNWSEQQRKSFCNMARRVHDLGLDWYRTNIPQVRFGRKDINAARAIGTLASFDAASARIRFTHSSRDLGLRGTFYCTPEDEASFAAVLDAKKERIANWMPPTPARKGLWPGYDEPAATQGEDEVTRSLEAEPTNLILYGPPGTGKTYRTAEEAVRLCDGHVPEDRDVLMRRYRALHDARQIEFVTFHQNFSYEEFIEGLRPDVEDDGQSVVGFSLKPEAGVFKRVAERALKPVLPDDSGFSIEGRRIFKMSLGQSNDPHSAWVFEESLDEGYALFGFKDVDWSDGRFGSRDAILSELERRYPDERVTLQMGMVKSPDRFRNQLAIGDLIVASKGLNAFRAIGVVEGEYEYAPRDHGRYSHRRRVNWLWSDVDGIPVEELSPGTRFSLDTIYEMPRSRLNLPVLERLINSGEGATTAGKLLPHVLVIDEINRANISKVFGELITLIEPDKRLGMPNALTVRLPYSKREFGVPANLHIIGTMNTADRSIALLDTALRRRFRFEEMAPDTSVEAVQQAQHDTGLPIAAVIDTMNRRIEYLVDRDHRIGHAFFIGCEDKADVDAVMRDKVIPLLQEYFFDDWNRLAAVLGEKDKGGNFLVCDKLDDPMGEGEQRNSWRVRESFEAGAYQRLVTGKPEQPAALHNGEAAPA